ncbi:MalY/PatB family protein [Cerasicoccus arenae]|uniref:cysteine-S-conjugate beta-lyase n=1 Tax=Cerasicoccus arenae TaxID=424488 RepID=A0A8J3GG41_9BACT|nr:PatB family C-S lyase [Cerasicoccus arenae]MBK1859398.1 PatB family C-S lyase [Cerasicoccus arenae]GHC10760.1 aspartate aminotransferase [Cerasicoccus arenae]
MAYDFTSILDRSGTGSLKWDRYAGRDVLPLWVADMDFRSAPEIIDALNARTAHGVLGYTLPNTEVVDAVLGYLSRVHGYEAKAEWLHWLPGVVPALNVVARAYGERGDSVLTCTPVYPPFLSCGPWQEKSLISSHLKQQDGEWTFDFDDLEAKVTPNTRIFILCNPHNPVGRVYREDELLAIADFCKRHDLILISDEIHCDLLFDDNKHRMTATLSEEINQRTVTLNAPSKTYNIPGLACSFAVIPNAELRLRFKQAARGFITEVNPYGYVGCAAAYNHGEPWRQELMTYLTGNRDYLYDFVSQHLPGIEFQQTMEATYLAWMNVEDLKAKGVENPHAFFIEHGVGLSPGSDFGDDRFLRLNFGCPRSVLEQALERMAKAVAGL